MSRPEFTCEVHVQYLPEQSDPPDGPYAFAYTVTIRNTGDITAQLVARRWVITDAEGNGEEVRGLAVVGQQPLLKPGEAFEYTSGCRLRTASGSMHGSYLCVAEDGEQFDCPIALFLLEADTGGGPGRPATPRVLH